MKWIVNFMEWFSSGMAGCTEPRWLIIENADCPSGKDTEAAE